MCIIPHKTKHHVIWHLYQYRFSFQTCLDIQKHQGIGLGIDTRNIGRFITEVAFVTSVGPYFIGMGAWMHNLLHPTQHDRLEYLFAHTCLPQLPTNINHRHPNIPPNVTLVISVGCQGDLKWINWWRIQRMFTRFLGHLSAPKTVNHLFEFALSAKSCIVLKIHIKKKKAFWIWTDATPWGKIA